MEAAESTSTSRGVPAIMTGHTLQSLRDAGYSLSAAVAEVIDNSIEAEANQVSVVLEDVEERGKAHIERIIVADDGTGMGKGEGGEDVLQYYLQLGYSTRYMSKETIGKYGVGAKLAALNFAERIDVWSCAEEGGWRHVYFDLEEALETEHQGDAVLIREPTSEPIPAELEYLRPEGAGTIVAWSKIDRLKASRTVSNANKARLELEKDISRMFREFIHGGIVLSVNETDLKPHDPLFLMDETWGDAALKEWYEKRPELGLHPVPDHFPAELIADEEIKVGGSTARLKVTLYPPAATRDRGAGRDALAKKLRLRENEGAISFMRLDREINYTNVPKIFSRGIERPDRYIGIEVSFKPELDEYFGVRHVKRGVEPHGDLRDKIRTLLQKYVKEARGRLDNRWGEVSRKKQEHTGEHTSIVEAVNEANRTLPKGRVREDEDPAAHDQALEDLARDVGKTDPEEQEAYVEQARDRAVLVESVDFPGPSFIEIQHFSNQVIIRLNVRHRFYRELWEPIKEIAELDPGVVSREQAVRTARRTIEALSLLLVAYGKAESMDQDPNEHFTDLRNYWGQFLESLLGKVKDVV